MALERAGDRELAELMPDHVLCDEDGDMLAPVVNSQRVADHLREDRRATRPCLDNALFVPRIHIINALQQFRVGVRPFFE